MILSVLIPTIPSRSIFFDRLMADLRARPADVEIVVDDSDRTLGAKRNHLLAKANGEWSVFCDDDDLFSVGYFDKVLPVLADHAPDAVGYWCQYYEDGNVQELAEHRTSNKDFYRSVPDATCPSVSQMYLRPITQINPVRTSIARQVESPDSTGAEDVPYVAGIAPLIRSEIFINEVMYHYFFRNNKDDMRLWERRARTPRGRA